MSVNIGQILVVGGLLLGGILLLRNGHVLLFTIMIMALFVGLMQRLFPVLLRWFGIDPATRQPIQPQRPEDTEE